MAAVVEPTDVSDTDVESLLWTCKECYVYQIPPLKNESGHRANDWDVNKWLWSGALKVSAKGNTLHIVLHDPNSGEIFAQCPVKEQGSKAVDQVIDSSRYFALRIDDGKGRHAYVGMGFRDRSHAYDFNATMIDHWKGVRRQHEAEELLEAEARGAAEPMRDLSLKDGETLSIKVNVPGASGKPRAPRPKPAGGGGLMLPPPPGPGLLAPPPKAGAPAPAAAPPAALPAAAPAPAAPAAATPAATPADDDDFGDFEAPSADTGNGDDDFGDFGDFSSASEK